MNKKAGDVTLRERLELCRKYPRCSVHPDGDRCPLRIKGMTCIGHHGSAEDMELDVNLADTADDLLAGLI